MNEMLLTSQPITLLIVTAVTAGLIMVGRRTKERILPGLVVLYSIGFLIYHSVCLNGVEPEIAPAVYFSITADMVLLFLGFISYLWIDDLSSHSKDKDKYRESLSWFWEKL